MGSSIPRPVIAQAVVVFMAVALFTGVLTIAGSVPSSDLPEHALHNASNSEMPGPKDSPSATVTPMPAPAGGLKATAKLATDIDDMLAQPDMETLSLPVHLFGNGSQTTASFRLEPGTVTFDLRPDAPGNFEVWLMYGGNERFDRLLEYGVIAEGPVTEPIVNGGTYSLDVTGDGEWQIDVSQLPG